MKINFTISAIILLIISGFVFTSCTKETSFESSNSFLQSDSNFLDKIYYLEDQGSGFDTFYTTTFFYDALKRNVRIDMVPADPTEIVYTHLFTYTGSDTKPSLTTNYEMSAEDHDTTIRYHFYDGAGRLIKDSGYSFHHDLLISVDSRAAAKRTYNYTGNKIYSNYEEFSLPSDPPYYNIEYDTATVDAFNNITNVKHYYPYLGNNVLLYDYSYGYDNKPSPFTKLTSLPSLKEIPNGDSFFEEYSFTNMISSAEHYIGSYSYVFNAVGFPVSATALVTDLTSGTTSTVKLIYTYKTL